MLVWCIFIMLAFFLNSNFVIINAWRNFSDFESVTALRPYYLIQVYHHLRLLYIIIVILFTDNGLLLVAHIRCVCLMAYLPDGSVYISSFPFLTIKCTAVLVSLSLLRLCYCLFYGYLWPESNKSVVMLLYVKARTERRNWIELNWHLCFLTNWPMGKQGEHTGHWLTRTWL